MKNRETKMTIKSMTGFGSAEVEGNRGRIQVEIRSYNHRFLDLRLKVHRIMQPMEARIYQWAKKRLVRGRVEILMQWEDLLLDQVTLQFRPEALLFYTELEGRLRDEFGLPGELDISSVIRLKEVVSPSDAKPDLEEAWEDLLAGMEKALEKMEQMQEREGQALRKDLEERFSMLSVELDSIEKTAKSLPEKYQEKLEERVSRLLAPELYDPQRFAQEIVLYVDKIDITEEIVRLRSHLDVARRSLAEDSMKGKRLDFLAQEILRELNTIGSKSAGPDIIHRIVQMKTELEKIREQAQNLL